MPSKFDPKKHHRRSIRLQNYDYSQPGAYFVTIVAWHRECLFGEVIEGVMKLNKMGEIVQWEWLELPQQFGFIELGAFIVMPNHFHGILIFDEAVRATRPGLTRAPFGNASSPHLTTEGIDGSSLTRGPKPASLGAIMAQFKSRVTKRLWKIPSLKGTPIWQRNYYEHLIRNERDLQNKTNYIEANAILWDQDDENPMNIKTQGHPINSDAFGQGCFPCLAADSNDGLPLPCDRFVIISINSDQERVHAQNKGYCCNSPRKRRDNQGLSAGLSKQAGKSDRQT